MAQRRSGGFGIAKATGGSLVALTALPLAIALEANTPLFGTTFWYGAACACLVAGLLLSFYGWLIPSLTGVRWLQTANETLQRDKEKLEGHKKQLESDKGELRRDKETLERENADLRARVRDAEHRSIGSFPARSELHIHLGPHDVSPAPGVDAESRYRINTDPKDGEDEEKANESPSHP